MVAISINLLKKTWRRKVQMLPSVLTVAPWPADSVYTERYMGLPTPDDNLAAYESSDVTRMADNFRGKKFFLIHGTADDNVHYQQSMMLARVLEKADILFDSQVGWLLIFWQE